jgi:hypothetical protein
MKCPFGSEAMIKEAPGLMERPRVGVRQFCLFEEVSTTKYRATIEDLLTAGVGVTMRSDL